MLFLVFDLINCLVFSVFTDVDSYSIKCDITVKCHSHTHSHSRTVDTGYVKIIFDCILRDV